MNAFRFKFKPGPPEPTNYLRQNNSDIIDPTNIASRSRADEKKEVVCTLLAQVGNENLTVHPIVGMRGLGKTTLAQLIYNDPEIQKHFELRLWVCVSDNFDVESLANRIKLQNAVSGKRYLLVLDDVWNRDKHKWDRLKSYLQHGGRGSSLLTTTRDEKVAQLMGTIEAKNLKSLDEIYIKEIIETKAFGSKQVEERPRELVEMVGDIVKRCSGSPLAATALGSENGILTILKLSYNCLPSYMQQCFAFCAMFPKDYEIDVQSLIHLWMANGFVPEQPGSVAFDQTYSTFGEFEHMYCSRITCTIHDLMHDVTESSMGRECAAIATYPSQSEDALHSARHLYLSKGYPAFQTLICDGYVKEDMKILSKYNSIRALKIKRGSLLRPKYLHHLRYLDLSGSDIEALPENISILYHLQTLNLSNCRDLERLPKELKYLTSLRHLYTHKCPKLKSMPAELELLTSLQTLTCFVLRNLDLGGRLELSQLENVTGADVVEAASLGNKKKLTELELRWAHGDQEAQNNNHKEVVLRIYSCGICTFPTWMDMLNGMVEFKLSGCKNVEKLPPLWQLPVLEILNLEGLQILHCLCIGGTTPVTFQKLKVFTLIQMPNFEAWWDTNVVQGDEPIFSKVEELAISRCGSLTALPKAASVIMESSGGVDTKCRSAFPALRKMTLRDLNMFDRWEAIEGTVGEGVTFPQLEELEICNCASLSALPKGSVLVKHSFGGAETAASRYIPSLSSLSLDVSPDDAETTLLHVKEKWNHELPLEAMWLRRCDLLFSSHSNALALWACFARLGLVIYCCNDNVKSIVFGQQEDTRLARGEGVVQLDTSSSIPGSSSREATTSTAVLKLSSAANHRFFPCLESLAIWHCNGLSEVANLPPSIKTLCIYDCGNLQSLSGQLGDIQKLNIHSCSLLESLDSCLGELRSLEELELYGCKSLVSLPDGPQAYSSLRVLGIEHCDGVKSLPPSLQSRLDCLEQKDLDARYEGNI
ncbi:hypothetical protein PVAP13_2NG265806 [Panicum virgatum]|nr:hypothetical protein PVAP13_2NG265806 [Panicum virgatum]